MASILGRHLKITTNTNYRLTQSLVAIVLSLLSSVSWPQTTYEPIHTQDAENLFIYMPPAPPPGSNAEKIGWVLQGYKGYDGRSAGCYKAPGGGGDGYTPPPITQTLTENYTYANDDAIVYVSRAGSGGKGGDGGDQGLACGGNYSGRTGGKGAAGGDIDLTFNPTTAINKKTYLHTGLYAYTGIFLQSLGGNGGDGGANGGNGGSGGVGGTVKLENNVSFKSVYQGGYGIFAQSLGGWGGSGSDARGIFWSGNGGVGSIGAKGGTVQITNTGNILTPYGVPIFAQSMGGKGGDGGGSTSLFAGVGGAGGFGGPGGDVSVKNLGNLSSEMIGSFGIFAQSVGGGGGSGGSAAGLYSLGAKGGEAASAGSVAVSNSGQIELKGASSIGIYSQSVGGGGGIGGLASGVVTFGGSGGDGGNGSSVLVTNSGLVSTGDSCRETDAQGRCVAKWNTGQTNGGGIGVLAQSIGGGGGVGGMGISSVMGSFVSIAVSGSGGSGGTGGSVYANNSGSIATNEVNSSAILAQSIGGGGGSAGGAISADTSFLAAFGYAKSEGGGSGGNGGKVGVNCISATHNLACSESESIKIGTPASGAYILTSGASSPGILAQSIGGGGGNGGFAIAAAASSSFSAGLSFGGKGEAAGSGNYVYVSPNGVSITTSGSDSPGVQAASIGGGGGSGGESVSGALGTNASISIAMGGTGANGGAGGNVVIENINNINGSSIPASVISTAGDRSIGLLAQSIGGGGGSGGTSISASIGSGSVDIGIGGSARSGMSGWLATVTNDGDVSTSGFGASAIAAQSIGGGGGNGGNSFTGNASEIGVNLSVGGKGGQGANSWDAFVINTGNLTTTGGGSPVILAQSIAGGGGNGGMTTSGIASFIDLSASIGGTGGNGGTSRNASVTNSGTITSQLSNSQGILAQSIGGGGGNGGFSANANASVTGSLRLAVGGKAGQSGTGGQVSVTNWGDIATFGTNSSAIMAESIGGTGGSGGISLGGGLTTGLNINTNIGGAGSTGGSSDVVNVDNYGQIFTKGALSNGIVAQSIGGAGGNGGAAVSGNVSLGGALTLNIGNGGGSGGEGRSVTVNTYNNIRTEGDQSVGVLAQSMGGSGGNGGSVIATSLAQSTSGSIGIGSNSGHGGSGGVVKINVVNDSITTSGLNSVGIIGESIGGHGGNGGSSQTFSLSDPAAVGKAYSISASVGGDGGYGGVSNSVVITQTGAINTAGITDNPVVTDGSIGILAQSIAGSGGNGGNATSNAIAGSGAISMSVGGAGSRGANVMGTVSVSSNEGSNYGGIRTAGANAPAILAQSIGGNGGNGGWSQSSSSTNQNAVAAAIGGAGDGGGAGSGVYIAAGGAITTTGMQSSGIIAQSIGGGGGSGGLSSSQAASSPGSAAKGVTASVGNVLAATGGNSSAVDVAKWATEKGQNKWNPTEETPDNGVSAALAVGGLGGYGGTSAWVTVNNIASIMTLGTQSNGIVAQSIGGGGGNGGDSTTGADGGKFSSSLSVGGYGENGGSSGTVTVNNWGYISTAGKQAIGIYAQSIGGGGGSGGSSVSSSTAAAGGAAAISLGIGGSGASGGVAGDVVVQNFGTILTSGIKSTGIYAQSVGGGGGNAGSSSVSSQVAAAASDDSGSSDASTGGTSNSSQNNLSNSSTAGNTIPNRDNTQPTQFSTAAGSNHGTAVGMTIGGFGGSGGTGGTVTVTNDGLVITGNEAQQDPRHAALGLSDGSIGIFAQSVGGGGGDGGSTSSNADGSKNSVSLALGGFGGTGGNAGAVTVTNSGSVATYGNNSTAIFAQSVGGGGGNGGASAVTSGSGGSNAVAIGLGGRGSAAGTGGSVFVTNSGSIATYGVLSYGIFAQSLGGGGGNGGDVSAASNAGTSSDDGSSNSTGTSSASTTGTKTNLRNATPEGGTSAEAKSGVSMAASLGGAGGAGGHADKVEVTNTGTIYTAGIGSTAILAQSIGGGGGNSGASSSESNGGAYNANLSLGMKGGSGGAGGIVSVNSSGVITTAMANAMGIFAQSVGGGGGNATSNSATSSGSSGKAGVSMSMGANGGSGNTGGTVTVSQNGLISTQGVNSIGIFAQSIGGGGGNGAISQSSSNGGDAAVALSMGGTGGSGGSGGAVNVYSLQSIGTQGANAQGIFAQSVGGGGGNGGSSASTSGDGGSFNANLTLGGSGVTGANAGAVFVSSDVKDYNLANSTSLTTLKDQVISTTGVNSQGILAQSIGGGGGNGGDSNSSTNNSDENTSTKMVGLSLGGKSGAGGNGGTVTVNNTLAISTTGAKSEAILAQSIGGGGGNGGSSSTGPADNASTFNLALGANGGSGGNGDKVSVTSTGSLSTTGINASALVAQSIAGGGGSAGATDNNSFSYASSAVNTLVTSSLLGATAGTSGVAGSVTVNTGGDSITTTAHNSMGIVAQSINGGGGISNTVLNYNAGSVTYNVGLGGTSVSSASANTVEVTSGNQILTGTYDEKTAKRTGANSIGILAQSIGGGGGVSSTVVSGGSVALDPSYIGGQSSTQNGQTVGSSGNGLEVTIKQTGAITTYGPAAMGIVAQSVGGGGGYASLASLSNTNVTNGSNIKIGGSSQSSGNGGEVNVTVSAPITTYGNGSVGVIAQSVGGGGGILATSGISGITPTFVGGTGNGGNVTVYVDAPITIRGAGVYGVIAQSIGGGGGMLASEYGVVDGSGKGGGEGGVVTVNVNKSIYVNGQTIENQTLTSSSPPTAYGVYAKSIGTSDPSVTVAQGASVVASGGSVAISVDGLVNRLTNHGVIVASNPQVDTTVKIVGAGGVTEIANYGFFSGPLSNDGSVISLTNRQSGRLYLTNIPNLGGGILTNEGYLQFGLPGQIATHQVNPTGEFVQTSTGILGLNLNFAGNLADRIYVASSRLFELGGKIQPVLVNAGMIHPGEINKTILNTGGLSNVRISDDLGVAGQTAIMSFSLSRSGDNLNLHAKADFAPAGLSQFGSQVGQAIGQYQGAGSNAFFQAATAQLVEQPTVADLDQAYTGLAGTAIQAVPQAVFQAVSQGVGSYTDRMNDWRVSTATTKSSRMAAFNQPQRYASAKSVNSLVDAASNDGLISGGRSGSWVSLFQSNVFSKSLTDRIVGGTIGFEMENDRRNTIGGIGVTLSQSGYTYNNAPTPITPGNTTNVGLSFYGMGRGENAYLSGIGYLGGGNSSFTRQLQTMNFYSSTNVSLMSYVAAARIESGYSLEPFRRERSNLKITPFVAVQPTYIHQNAAQDNFSSVGLGTGFNYSATDNTAVPVFAGLELSGNHMTENGIKISPFFRASWMAETKQNGQMGANYSGQGVNVFFSGSPNLGNAMLYKAGSVFGGERVSGYFTLDYDYGNASYAYRNYGVTGGLKYAF